MSVAVLAAVLLGQVMMAETITLRSGKVVTGSVILQNEDVIVLKDATGARFQFPMADVEKVEESTEEEVAAAAPEKEEESVPKVALRICLTGGGSAVPDRHQQPTMGGNFGAEVQIGSRNLMNKRVFVGGSIGYSGIFAGQTYSLIPLKAIASVPLTDGRHAPEVGMNIGYAFGTGPVRGGLTGGAEVSWRYQINQKLAFLLGVHTRFTQVTIPVEEIVNTQIYINNVGRTIVCFGLTSAIQF